MGQAPAAKVGLFVAILAILTILPLLLGTVISEVLGSVMIYVLLGLGLNIVVGYAGLLDLGTWPSSRSAPTRPACSRRLPQHHDRRGHAGPVGDLNFYVAVWIVALLARGRPADRRAGAATARRLPRDRDAWLGEIVSVITASKWAQPLIGGPQGMRGVTKAEVFGLNFQDNPQHFYYLALAFVLLAAFVSWRLSTSRIGRAWNAMREDEQVADAMGISTTKFKLLAFALGGAIGSLGGALRGQHRVSSRRRASRSPCRSRPSPS